MLPKDTNKIQFLENASRNGFSEFAINVYTIMRILTPSSLLSEILFWVLCLRVSLSVIGVMCLEAEEGITSPGTGVNGRLRAAVWVLRALEEQLVLSPHAVWLKLMLPDTQTLSTTC